MDDSVDDILSVPGQPTPESGQIKIPAPPDQTRKAFELTLWRTIFLFGAVFTSLMTLEVAWVSSIGGVHGLEGWVMRITSTAPSDGPARGWIEISVFTAMVVATTIFAWLLQSRAARELFRSGH
jgi:hypothetical protein